MKDISGIKFNKLTAIRPSSNKNKNGIMWECFCDCGVVKDILGYKLTSGSTKSCGCLIGKTGSKDNRLNDLTGCVFSMLTVIDRAENISNRTSWNCLCECGNFKVIESRNLVGGCVKSCGCGSNKLRSNACKSHGMSKTPTYKSWIMMKSRCLNEKYSHYGYYGGRGIKICEEWLVFDNFLLDMGERPQGTTIDRIDNSLGYFKENCQWATTKIQSNNKRSTLFYSVNGVKKSMSEWANHIGVDRKKIYGYMYRNKINCIKAAAIGMGLSWDD